MARRDDDSSSPDEGGKEFTRVDAAKERKITALGDPNKPKHGVSYTFVVAILVVLIAAAGIAVYRQQTSNNPLTATTGSVQDTDTSGAAQPADNANEAAAAPKVPDNFVFSPEFEISTGTFTAGSAFVVKMADRPRAIVLTALHLFGPAGGLPKQIAAADLPSFVKHASFYNVFENEEQVCSADIVIPMPAAAPFDQNSATGDVVAFLTNIGANVPVVKFAQHAPKPGDAVYLAARVAGGAPATQRLHRGIVISGGAQSFSFRYDNQALNVTGTSGAPVLNQSGEIIGINLGVIDEGGKVSGFAHSIERFKTGLIAAVKEIEAREKYARKDPALSEATPKVSINPNLKTGDVRFEDVILPIGQSGKLGKMSVEVDQYFLDPGEAGQISYAGLSARLGNAGDEPMSLPAVDVHLLDEEGRQFKPAKNKTGGSGALNPLVKVRNLWGFQIPAEVTPAFAVFKIREGSLKVDLKQRTAENKALIESEDFAPSVQELSAFASPRYLARQQYEKAKSEADQTNEAVDALNKDIAKLNKKIKTASDSYDSARNSLEKLKHEIEQGANRTQRDVDRAVDEFKKREDIWKELEKELKEMNNKLKSLNQKLETQQKAADTLKQKIP